MMPSDAIGWGYSCLRVCAGQEDGVVAVSLQIDSSGKIEEIFSNKRGER